MLGSPFLSFPVLLLVQGYPWWTLSAELGYSVVGAGIHTVMELGPRQKRCLPQACAIQTSFSLCPGLHPSHPRGLRTLRPLIFTVT